MDCPGRHGQCPFYRRKPKALSSGGIRCHESCRKGLHSMTLALFPTDFGGRRGREDDCLSPSLSPEPHTSSHQKTNLKPRSIKKGLHNSYYGPGLKFHYENSVNTGHPSKEGSACVRLDGAASSEICRFPSQSGTWGILAKFSNEVTSTRAFQWC